MNPHVDVDVLPVIYRQNFPNQSSSIPLTTIVVPVVDSHYRVSIILTGSPTDAQCLFSWTDEVEMEEYSFGSSSARGNAPSQMALVHVLANQSLSFQTVRTIGTYSLFVVAESLD